MNGALRGLFAKLLIVSAVFLLGAGDVSVYQGIVRSVGGNKITILEPNGTEKNCSLNEATRVFVTGKRLLATRIKPNSHVQLVVDRQDICRQIVVEEAPQ